MEEKFKGKKTVGKEREAYAITETAEEKKEEVKKRRRENQREEKRRERVTKGNIRERKGMR